MLRYLFIFFIFPAIAQEPLKQKVEIHGHRGFRGAHPENTLISFREAIRLGVDAIELDVVISKDSQVVVSHEPWFNYQICSEPDGSPVRLRQQHNLFKMAYSDIRNYDCGSRSHKGFLSQEASSQYKPLLSEVIEQMEIFCETNGLPPVTYNIEIKCGKTGDGKWHPSPEIFARLVQAVLKKYDIPDRILIQSFDKRSLQHFHKLEPDIRIGLLIANTGSVEHNIRTLGFVPWMYNPSRTLLKQRTVEQAHAQGCKVMVWTVNDEHEMKKFIQMGVDGLITDYPNIAIKLR